MPRPRRDHAHLVHHRRARQLYHLKELVLRGYWDGNSNPASNARSAISSASTWAIHDLPVGITCLFVGQVAELLLRDAVQEVGPLHGHQRRRAGGGFVLFEHRLS